MFQVQDRKIESKKARVTGRQFQRLTEDVHDSRFMAQR